MCVCWSLSKYFSEVGIWPLAVTHTVPPAQTQPPKTGPRRNIRRNMADEMEKVCQPRRFSLQDPLSLPTSFKNSLIFFNRVKFQAWHQLRGWYVPSGWPNPKYTCVRGTTTYSCCLARSPLSFRGRCGTCPASARHSRLSSPRCKCITVHTAQN